MKSRLILIMLLVSVLAPSLALAASDSSSDIPLPGGAAEKVAVSSSEEESPYHDLSDRIKFGPKIKYQITEKLRLTLKPRMSKVRMAMELKF